MIYGMICTGKAPSCFYNLREFVKFGIAELHNNESMTYLRHVSQTTNNCQFNSLIDVSRRKNSRPREGIINIMHIIDVMYICACP